MRARREGKKARGRGGATPSIEISGRLDRHAAEALQLEIRRLARQEGLDLNEIRIEEAGDDASAP